MGIVSVRKNNAGRAIIRFLIGLLIVAILVLLLYELVLKGDFNVKNNDVANTTPLIATNKPVSTQTGLPVNDTQNTGLSTDPTANPDRPTIITSSVKPSLNPVTPTPTPETPQTPTPTPTPVPTPSPIPESAFSQINASESALANAKKTDWKYVNNALKVMATQFRTDMNGSSAFQLSGYAYPPEDANFDGATCEVYLIVMTSKNVSALYDTTKIAGLSGEEHAGKGTNLSDCDFSANIDCSKYPDDVYRLGLGVKYTVNNKVYRFVEALGDAYNITVVKGVITAVMGIEQ